MISSGETEDGTTSSVGPVVLTVPTPMATQVQENKKAILRTKKVSPKFPRNFTKKLLLIGKQKIINTMELQYINTNNTKIH